MKSTALSDAVEVRVGVHAAGTAVEVAMGALSDAESLVYHHHVPESPNPHNSVRIALPAGATSSTTIIQKARMKCCQRLCAKERQPVFLKLPPTPGKQTCSLATCPWRRR